MTTANDTVTTQDRYAHADGMVTRQVGGEKVIVPVRSNVAQLDAIYTLNETASFIWDRLDGRRTVAELVSDLVAEFAVAPSVAEEDVNRLVADLQGGGLVRLVSQPAPASR